MIELNVRHPARVLVFEPGDVIPEGIGAVEYPSGVAVAILPLEEQDDDAKSTAKRTITGAIELSVPGLGRYQ